MADVGNVYRDNHVYKTINITAISDVRFGLWRFGQNCNGSTSNPFSKADCALEKIISSLDKRPCMFRVKNLFGPCIDLLKKMKNDASHRNELAKDALNTLEEFFRRIDLHEESLIKGLLNADKLADVKLTLAAHLLGKLSTGEPYWLDIRDQNKGTCRCGCDVHVRYDNTGIGHENVWHGFVDVIFPSQCTANIISSVSTSNDPGYNETDEYDDEEILEDSSERPVKKMRKGTEDQEDLDGSEDQIVAQTVVFSLLQKSRHSLLPNYLIPNIVISKERIHIIMYDSQNDILIGSQPVKLFSDMCLTNGNKTVTKRLTFEAVTVIWMVLHHRLFCSGIPTDFIQDLRGYQSNFKEKASGKWKFYSEKLKFGADHFPKFNKYATFFSTDELFFGHDIIPQPLQLV